MKAVSEHYDTLSQQPVTSSTTVVTSSTIPVLPTMVGSSLPSSVMPKVKPIQKQQKLAETTAVVATQSPATSSQPRMTSGRQHLSTINHHNSGSHFVSSNSSPLCSSEEFSLVKNIKTTIPVSNMVASKSIVATKGGHLAYQDDSMQQHTDVAKQIMKAIHQEKENQQSSERQLFTLSMTISPTSSPVEQHSSWPELLSQDEQQRVTPSNMQEQQNVAPPIYSSKTLPSAPVSKSPYATQALPTANTVTHMPSTAVKVAKAPPSFFTTTRAPPTTVQATPTTKSAQATVTAIRTSTVVTTPVVQVTATPTNKAISMSVTGIQATPTNKAISMSVTGIQATPINKLLSISTTGSQATPINKVLSISATGSQATPTSKALSIVTTESQATPPNKAFSAPATGSHAMPITSRTLPAQYQSFSVPTSAVKTSGFAGAVLTPPTTMATGSSPTLTGSPRGTSSAPVNLEMPVVQLPKPPFQLFQDGENGYFFEQYGRMVSVIL